MKGRMCLVRPHANSVWPVDAGSSAGLALAYEVVAGNAQLSFSKEIEAQHGKTEGAWLRVPRSPAEESAGNTAERALTHIALDRNA